MYSIASRKVAFVAMLSLMITMLSSLAMREDASATIGWPKMMTNGSTSSYAPALTSLPNGTVVQNCGYDAPHASTSFDEAGVELGSIDSSSPSWSSIGTCAGESVVAADGITFALHRPATVTANTEPKFGAFSQDGVRQWSMDLGSPCALHAYSTHVTGAVMGDDGNVYFMTTNAQCASQNATLYGVNPQGVQVFAPITLNMSTASVYGHAGHYNLVQPFDNGLVVFDGNELRYFSYGGVEDTGRQHSFTSVPNDIYTGFAVNPEGDVYVARDLLNDVASSCPHSVTRIPYTGSVYVHDLHQNVPCLATKGLVVTPNGGAASLNYNAGVDAVIEYGAMNIYAYELLPLPANTTLDYSTEIQADMAGHLYLSRFISVTTGATTDEHVQIMQTDHHGNPLSAWTSEQIGTSSEDTFGTFRYGHGFALSEGRVYVTVCYQADHCNNGYMTPNPAYPVLQTNAIQWVGASLDYPRGAQLGVTPPAPSDSAVNYVALGDSFSSGEGVPPYAAGTDMTGVNECHRSTSAYPRLLEEDTTLDLQLDDFSACSGARTVHIRENTSGNTEVGQWGENAQKSLLSNNTPSATDQTDLVTLTIGGNDVGFGRYAETCVYIKPSAPGCSVEQDSFTEVMDNIYGQDFYNNLKTTLLEVRDSVQRGARVVVLTYPYITPGIDEPIDPGYCFYLSEGERYAAREVVDALNWVITNAIYDVNQTLNEHGFNPVQIDYLDAAAGDSPFQGHEMCQSDGYFNGVDAADPEHSFHPNAEGQAAYAQMIKQYYLDTMVN